MWSKFDWKQFAKIYLVISAVSLVIIFAFGLGCDDNFDAAPRFCQVVFAILLLLCGFGRALTENSNFFNEHGLLSFLIALAIHSYLFMMLSNVIRFISKRRNQNVN